MSISSDWLLDRIKLKRRLRFWQGLGVVALCAFLLALGARFEIYGTGDHIARIWVDGVIRDDELRDHVLNEIAKDPNTKALIVRINSPGGTVVGGEALYGALRNVSETKPVVAVMGEIAASAGYMTALGTDYITAHSGTLTGSIGVLMQSADVTGLLDKVGVKPVIIKSDPLKAAPNPLEPLTPESEKATQAVIKDMYEMFLTMVADRREMGLEEARILADGRVYTGRQALQNNLIDSLGGESSAIEWLKQEKKIPSGLEILDISYEKEEFWPQAGRALFGDYFDKTLISKGLTLDGLISVWHP